MRQHNQFQVTFYINGKILCLAARVQGCQPVRPTRLFTLKRPKQKKARLPFFPKKVLQFVQTWRICFCNDQGPALTRTIHLVDKNKKQLARDCTEVGTQTKSIYGAFCQLRVCSHIKQQQPLRSWVLDFSLNLYVSRCRNVLPVKKREKISFISSFATSNFNNTEKMQLMV